MNTAGGAEARGNWWLGVWLAGAYLVTHGVLIYQSLGPGTSGANDVRLYAWWVQESDRSGLWLGIDSPWVYPVGALAPILLASILGTGTAYLPTWCAMVALINLATAVVVVRRFGVTRAAAPLVGWFVFLMLLGPCGIGRLDAIMMPLVLIALVVASARPALASILLTFGAWIKVSAGAALIPLLAVVGAWRSRLRQVLIPAASTCVAVVLLQFAAGGQWRFLTSFVGAETDRGLQIEAVLATPVVLAHAAKGEALAVWNSTLSTNETWGAGADVAVRVSDIAMPLAVLAVGALVWRARRQTTAALLTGTLAMMSGLIVTHKVGSPQFVAWLAPAVVVGLCVGRRLKFWLPVGIASLVMAALTGWLYPWGYVPFISGDRLMLAVWVVRNALLVAVFAFAVVELVRLGRPGLSAAGDLHAGSAQADPDGAAGGTHDGDGLGPSPASDAPGPAVLVRDTGNGCLGT
ncbi:MAG: glycosyltransferase 87 family protein [Bifidobacteriaceae bacterium]|jgi:hypothetical protein|nr:glycosyltransferase 87 family protein [Bifidobacteriaceae bacterium]